MKVSVFIDGFNLYHSISKLDSAYKWLDLSKLSQRFLLKSDILKSIYYFTAFPQWDEGKVKRQKQYIKALKRTGIVPVIGKFKRVTKKCRASCKEKYKTFEEKQTDVNMSIYILKSIYNDDIDKILLISADSDLTPVLKLIQEDFPNKKSHVVIPTGLQSIELKHCADFSSKIKTKHLRESLFPKEISLKKGTLLKPETW